MLDQPYFLLDKVPIFCYLFKGYYFEQITGLKKMMKLAIIFLPIIFALIWALFIGLRINRVENRHDQSVFSLMVKTKISNNDSTTFKIMQSKKILNDNLRPHLKNHPK